MNGNMVKNLTANCIWRVKYDVGTFVWERNPDNGKETLFKELDQDRIKEVDILNPIKELDDLLREEVKTMVRNSRGEVVELKFSTYQGQRLVLFRRQLKHTGQYLAVMGDPEMLNDEYRKKYEENNNTKVQKPQVIGYPMEYPNETMILIGWQSTIGGKNIKSVCLVHSDGRVEMKPDR